MSLQNVLRHLDRAVTVEGYGYKTFTEKVAADKIAACPGSYFCDASSGNLAIQISETVGEEGYIVIVKKIDDSTNVVIVSVEGSTIDGSLVPVTLRLRHESLSVQFHDGEWYII